MLSDSFHLALSLLSFPFSVSEMDGGASRAVSSVYYYKKSNIFGVKINGKEVVKALTFIIQEHMFLSCRLGRPVGSTTGMTSPKRSWLKPWCQAVQVQLLLQLAFGFSMAVLQEIARTHLLKGDKIKDVQEMVARSPVVLPSIFNHYRVVRF